MWDGPHQLTCNSYCIRSVLVLRDFGHCRAVLIFVAESVGASNNTSVLGPAVHVCRSVVGKSFPVVPPGQCYPAQLEKGPASSSSTCKCRRHHTDSSQPLDLSHIRQSRRKWWAYGLSYTAWAQAPLLPCRQAGQPKRLPPPARKRNSSQAMARNRQSANRPTRSSQEPENNSCRCSV